MRCESSRDTAIDGCDGLYQTSPEVIEFVLSWSDSGRYWQGFTINLPIATNRYENRDEALLDLIARVRDQGYSAELHQIHPSFGH